MQENFNKAINNLLVLFKNLTIISLMLKIKYIIGTLTVIFFAYTMDGLFETNYAGYIKIRQIPITGSMDVYTKPGMFGQWFGRITEYKYAGTYKFVDNVRDKYATLKSDAISVRFRDGGLAKIAGTARFDLPLDREKLLLIHNKFRGYKNLADGLIKPVIAEALILTASLMTAEESYSGRRAEFAQLTLDQLLKGVYLTEYVVNELKNNETGEIRRIREVRIKYDSRDFPIRKPNPLSTYGINITQFPLDKDFDYEPGILAQISDQRDALMKTVSAKAEATKSQQDKITAEAKGQAAVMFAKYEAEVKKETATIRAQLDKEVAETDAESRLIVAQKNKLAAREYREEQILIGQGDAKRKKLILQADGALTQRLIAYTSIQKYWADAYSTRSVPSLVMASTRDGVGDKSTIDFSNAMQLLVAKQLGLDLGITNRK